MFIEKLFKRNKPMATPVAEPLPSAGILGHLDDEKVTQGSWSRAVAPSFQQPQPRAAVGTMDSGEFPMPLNAQLPLSLVEWYGKQSFIGYQLSAIMAQNWLIKRACWVPARDAVRKGYDVTVNDGTKINKKILDAIRIADKERNIKGHMREFIDQGRVFGIRVAMFVIDGADDKFYEKPFNIDGIKPGSYRGISQIDPYWITPELDARSASDPTYEHFYDPTWWRVNARRIHRSHLIIFRTEKVPDILKPTYFYGGVSVPQKIAERIYAAERTANEAPMLAMTKRLISMKLDLAQAGMQGASLQQKIQQWTRLMTNYGVKIVGLNEEVQQLETSLNDFDALMMSQYQLVAAGASMPVTKLLGTAPKGFDATGEYDESNYHEDLESLQEDILPMLERHHLLLIKSEIAPRFGIQAFATTAVWKPLDSVTALELANINKVKSDEDAVSITSGVISADEARDRKITDPQSGYSGLAGGAPEVEEEDDEEDEDPTQEV